MNRTNYLALAACLLLGLVLVIGGTSPPPTPEAMPLAVAPPPVETIALLAKPKVPVTPTHAEERGTELQESKKPSGEADILKQLQDGTTQRHLMVPMRDGVKLATDIFLPPGEGRFSTVLVRTLYGRLGLRIYAARLKKGNYAFVVQDLRGDGDSEGRKGMDYRLSENEIADSYDTVEWVAQQPWCNGRVGMFGGSGHGMAAWMAYLSKAPHLVVVQPGNTAGNLCRHWFFENGVRRQLSSWIVNRGMPQSLPDWPRPTVVSCDDAAWEARLKDAGKDNPIVFLGDDGWFNLFGDATLELFQYCGAQGRISLKIGPSAHGNQTGFKFPMRKRVAPAEATSDFLAILDGTQTLPRSRVSYFVMGDMRDPQASGNEWRSAERWPPAHEAQAWHFTVDGALTRRPSVQEGTLAYAYDPRNPAPSVGGHHFLSDTCGPLDQRPLKDRKDILRLVSEPLAEPLEVAGPLKAELRFATDATDTAFVVKLVDIYPDGYEALVRESAALARLATDPVKPVPLESSKPYTLAFGMAQTAYVFNKGHRVAVFVSSSSAPAYEVHPNSFEPVASMEQSKVAHQTIFCGGMHGSRLLLPVVKP